VLNQYMVYHQEDEAQRTNHVVAILEEERQRRAIQVERLRRRLATLILEADSRASESDATLSFAADAWATPKVFKSRLLDLAAEQKGLEAEAAFLKRPAKASEIEQQSAPNDRREQQLADIALRLAGLEGKKAYLLEELRAARVAASRNETTPVEIAFTQAELAREEKVFERIAERKLALQTEMRAPARVRFQRRAEVRK
jgi:hypothetical protein